MHLKKPCFLTGNLSKSSLAYDKRSNEILIYRTFVMPSGMCINPIHNKKGILDRSDNKTTEEG